MSNYTVIGLCVAVVVVVMAVLMGLGIARLVMHIMQRKQDLANKKQLLTQIAEKVVAGGYVVRLTLSCFSTVCQLIMGWVQSESLGIRVVEVGCDRLVADLWVGPKGGSGYCLSAIITDWVWKGDRQITLVQLVHVQDGHILESVVI